MAPQAGSMGPIASLSAMENGGKASSASVAFAVQFQPPMDSKLTLRQVFDFCPNLGAL
jgi:hypothetical protein